MTQSPDFFEKLSCPMNLTQYPIITLAHGGGGKLSQQLIEKIFYPAFKNDHLLQKHDSALIHLAQSKIAFSTDSYVVRPLFFPGGDIGKLAICGVVNDLAVAGARAKFLSVGFILEEGLPIETLWRVVCSMKSLADQLGVQIVTGDTKVVEKGRCDGMYINVSGIGERFCEREILPSMISPQDAIIVSGDLGRHGISVLSQRQGFEILTSDTEKTIESDCAPLLEAIEALHFAGVYIKCLRDLTRGGLAAALDELSRGCGYDFEIDENVIPSSSTVASACELLGLDPLHIANEGRFVAFVENKDMEKALRVLKSFSVSRNAALVGHVSGARDSRVWIKNRFGQSRLLQLPTAEMLPRIC